MRGEMFEDRLWDLEFKIKRSDQRIAELESTLRWLQDAVSGEQDEVISAVLRGTSLETAIEESEYEE